MPLAPAARDLIHLGPEVVLTCWGLLVLLVDLAALRGVAAGRRARVLGLVSLLGALLALVASFAPEFVGKVPGAAVEPSAFLGTIAGGPLVERLNAATCILLALVVAVSGVWAFTEHWGEYFALTLWAGVGMMLLMAAEELLTLFLSLELLTICFYLLSAFEKGRPRSPEAGLKYFVYGSVSSALFLFGLSWLYGLTGTTRLAGIGQALLGSGAARLGLAGNLAGATAVGLVLVGFGFKLAAAPFHQWAPDVYEGAPAPVAAWAATGSKAASVVALLKVLVQALGPYASGGSGLLGPGSVGLVAALAAISMTYGNFAALAQRNFKRMLAYSSIAHAGYLLVGILAALVADDPAPACGAVLFYLAIYAGTTLGAFALAAWLAATGADEIDDLDGLGARSPILAAGVVLLMLSLIGLPPFAGFWGKLFMFLEAVNTPSYRLAFLWLVGLGLFNTVVSAFYYARVLRALFLRPARAGSEAAYRAAPFAVAATITLAAALALGGGLAARPLVNDAIAVARSRLFRPGGTIPGAEDRSPQTPGTPAVAAQPQPAPAVARRGR